MKITGSKTISEVVKHFLPDGGNFKLEITGAATPIAGAEVAPTVRLAASDFFLALAGAGAVGEALLERAVSFAAARAEGKEIGEKEKEAQSRLAERAERLAEAWKERLPKIQREGSVQVKGVAVDVSQARTQSGFVASGKPVSLSVTIPA